jgi:hypothetical protein
VNVLGCYNGTLVQRYNSSVVRESAYHRMYRRRQVRCVYGVEHWAEDTSLGHPRAYGVDRSCGLIDFSDVSPVL